MFGYVVVNADKLTIEEKKQYRAFYCGLCKTLGTRHGIISRFTLTYDMTFLVLFLSALYKTDTQMQTERCIIHPLKPHEYCQNEISKYGADMNVVLAYYNFLDDWTDDRNILSLSAAKLFERQYKRIERQYPNQCKVIRKCLCELYEIEKSGELNPDVPAKCFGELMGEIFVLREDEYADKLRTFGTSLGKFIYIMDGCMDLKSDIKNERYNPMMMSSSEKFYDILNLLMADCIENYKRLPIDQNKGLIENILYSGVWSRYEAEKNKTKGVHK
ncbi:DUF5685 family protein [Clostridium estertheticum]|uniref:DUF5685 family protein n=1 Tax=Clostridium estertheticum TaxID=238834 RepID=UPI001CF2AC85|nr:DUF5685 family protein [Clostridium estertheticum]MCB2307062.1 DUF5685 family protein [Clostridium estertheticum]MCB2345870.1 DUF5685 family protein [Clostridium estertheticum]MCB2350538.1 DUF5685 family protein [Clostridium estertheticum]WAG45448.1 DUF5685 family protein [Clostridium estertheticum]